MICWRCKESVQGPICVSCGVIQPPPANPDYFSILGIPRRYAVTGLDEAHRMLTRRVHPDRFIKKSAVERRMALQWMASANEAKRIIKDPLIRARYLATGRVAPSERGNFSLPPEFLELIFELQMERDADPAGVKRQATEIHRNLMLQMEGIFEAWDADDGELTDVEGILAKLKYTTNLIKGH